MRYAPFVTPKGLVGSNIKFVADTMIQGVGKSWIRSVLVVQSWQMNNDENLIVISGKRLQQLGLDVLVLRNGDPHHACLDVHAAQNRVILTMGYHGEEVRHLSRHSG